MAFWLAALVMVGLSAALVLRALTRPLPDGAPPEIDLYRGQLAEIDRDLARGTIGPDEAAVLRVEIKRRLLERDRRRGPEDKGPDRAAGKAAVLAVLAVALAAGLAGYYRLGEPGYPDLPHAGRLAESDRLKAARPTQAEAEARATAARPAPAAPDPDFAALMERLRAALAERPGDIQGLRLLAENERKLGRLPEAARAQERLVTVLGDGATASDRAALADVLINAAGGIVTPEAEAAILATLKTDPRNPVARFYAGLLQAQVGRPDLAFTFWRPLYEESPPEAPWFDFLSGALPDVAAAAGADYAMPEPETDPSEMIAGMVDGLEARLSAEGGSAEEWARLVRSLGVLGETDRARAAWEMAQAALVADADGLEQVRAEAEAAGIAE
jgi:cytochrome c-type biogenesis protein CcmH